jgi:hypothetical protein
MHNFHFSQTATYGKEDLFNAFLFHAISNCNMAVVRIHESVVSFGFDDGNLSSTGARKITLNVEIDVKGTFRILTILHVVTLHVVINLLLCYMNISFMLLVTSKHSL